MILANFFLSGVYEGLTEVPNDIARLSEYIGLIKNVMNGLEKIGSTQNLESKMKQIYEELSKDVEKSLNIESYKAEVNRELDHSNIMLYHYNQAIGKLESDSIRNKLIRRNLNHQDLKRILKTEFSQKEGDKPNKELKSFIEQFFSTPDNQDIKDKYDTIITALIEKRNYYSKQCDDYKYRIKTLLRGRLGTKNK